MNGSFRTPLVSAALAAVLGEVYSSQRLPKSSFQLQIFRKLSSGLAFSEVQPGAQTRSPMESKDRTRSPDEPAIPSKPLA